MTSASSFGPRNFAATLKRGIVFLDFWASWCGPCRAFAPIFEGASQRHPDVVFGEVNTETERALAAAFQIRAIPTLAVSRDGVLLAVQPGMLLAAALDELVAKVRGLDMNEVQRELTKQEPHVESSPARTGGV